MRAPSGDYIFSFSIKFIIYLVFVCALCAEARMSEWKMFNCTYLKKCGHVYIRQLQCSALGIRKNGANRAFGVRENYASKLLTNEIHQAIGT